MALVAPYCIASTSENSTFLDSHGGWWQHRWGDTAVRTMAVAMFLTAEHHPSGTNKHHQYDDLPCAETGAEPCGAGGKNPRQK